MQYRGICGIAILIGTTACGLAIQPCDFAEAAIHEDYAGTVSGVVVDALQQPVAGASVWLVVSRPGIGSTIYKKTVADGSGRFQFPKVKLTCSLEWGEEPALIARDAQGRIGAQTYIPLFRPDLTIRLLPCKDCKGRLVDVAGKPIVGASVAPQSFSSLPVGCSNSDEVELFPELSKELTTKTDSNGHFILRGVPDDKCITAMVTAPGFGTPKITWRISETPIIQLQCIGTLVGKAVLPDSPAGVAGVPLWVHLYKKSTDEKWCVEHSASIVTDKAGQFICKDVPSGGYSVGVLSTGDVPYHALRDNSPRDFEVAVKPGETTTVSVSLHHAIAIRGRVIDKQTETGIPGIRVSAACEIDDRRQYRFLSTTDTQGKYTIYAIPGMVTVGVGGTVSDYVIDPSEVRFQDEVTKDFDCPAVKLQHGKTVEGVVVDDHGNPVADAMVYMKRNTRRSDLVSVSTDAAGKFVFRSVSPKEPIHVRARKEAAASDADTVVKLGEQSAPVQLAISESKSLRLHGICVDKQGRPVSNANISVSSEWTISDVHMGITVDSQTDAKGRFQIQGLWPSDRHQLQITAEGYATFRLDPIDNPPRKTHCDLGQLQLISTRGKIEGVVVDSQGHSLAGVYVLNHSYTMEPPAVKTDVSGHFCLEGFLPGAARVFAVKDGYRFTGIQTESGACNVVVKLLRKDEPTPARPQPTQSTAADLERQQKQLAQKIIDQLLAGCSENDEDERSRLVLSLAWIDPTAAAERAENLKGEMKTVVRSIAVLDVVNGNLNEWLKNQTKPKDAEMVCCTLMFLTMRYETSEPAKAIRCAEAMAAQARQTSDQSMQVEMLSQAAAVIGKCGGNKDLGHKWAEEAASIFLKIKSEEKRSQVCASVTEALAFSGVDRAIQFLKSIGEDSPHCLAQVATAAVTVDLKKARKILGNLPKEEETENVRARMAIRLAATHPTEAKQLLDDGKWHNVSLKVEALGWLAAAAAPRDKQLACMAIDDALVSCNDSTSRFDWRSRSRAILMAILAVQAKQIGYPDMENVLQQVLAARSSDSDSEHEDETTTVALFLSMADPALAKQLLLETGNAPGSVHFSGYNRKQVLWLAVWGMVDPKHANECLDREFAASKADKETLRNGLFAAAEMLSMRPSNRLRYFVSLLCDSQIVDRCCF
jgi:hypothetical protein